MELKKMSIWQKMQEKKHITVVAFGSSNTQRSGQWQHWFDILEASVKSNYGANLSTFINVGVGGDTSALMLDRFERDVARHNPDLVIVTGGGNDSKPKREISQKEFSNNLDTIAMKVKALNSEMILQTYYSCDLENLEQDYASNIPIYMELVRKAAQRNKVFLHDNYVRWEKLRNYNSSLYRLLMNDPMHINALGQKVLGLDWLKSCDLSSCNVSYAADAQFVCELLNVLNIKKQRG